MDITQEQLQAIIDAAIAANSQAVSKPAAGKPAAVKAAKLDATLKVSPSGVTKTGSSVKYWEGANEVKVLVYVPPAMARETITVHITGTGPLDSQAVAAALDLQAAAASKSGK